MAAGHSNLFVVRDRNDLARVITSIAAEPGSTPVVDISGEDTELFGERDLRRLFESAQTANVRLSLVTDDPLLAELARIHGVNVEGTAEAPHLSRADEHEVRPYNVDAAVLKKTILSPGSRMGEPRVRPSGSPSQTGRQAEIDAYSTLDAADRHWRNALTTLRLRLITPDAGAAGNGSEDSRQPLFGPTLSTVARPISGGSGATEAPPAPPRYGSDEERGSYSDASFAFVITPPTPRRPELAHPATQPLAAPARRRRAKQGQRRMALLSVAALLGVVLGVGAILVGFLAPYTTVTLTPATSTLSAELTYGVSGGDAPLDFALPSRTFTKTVTFEASLPTTGERFVPDQTAAGEVLFTNPTTVEAFLPAGTMLYAADGTAYTTAADLIVPAADPFGSLTFGSASVQVTAGEPGPAGNQTAEALTGQLDTGVYYSNRSEISGGTERRIAVVSEADKAALEQQARAAFGALSATELADQLQPGEEFLAGSFTAAEPQLTFDQQVGADAARLTIRGIVELNGAAYDPAELHAAAREALNAELIGLAPAGDALIGDSVSIGQPQPLGSATPPTFKLNGEAESRAVIPPEQLAAAREGLVGANAQQAARVVAALPGVASSEVEVGPSWLPFGRTPRLESRVTIEVLDEPSQPASAPQPTGP